ncbi:GAF domain-containing protein [Falsirhodobacter sp. 20TX0035]|uniref:GAF domain-containing protein n=1 Tax=Falsirhodobacter sp. 20TX0035 TaxID=3022019 RepID=UPI00232B04CD|nr:GAF domain-containing protein [Falsirhodobacter sp. 20TX0035]MDB6453599.1 HWE histidine kinase domain-containing protein [Falsirhodobacter sp. 20TX0035]
MNALGILDTPSEPEFDNIVIVARSLCQAPVSLISLVHKERQWFKARSGFDPHETPLNQSVCLHTLAAGDLLVVPDLTLDPRTHDNPLVTGDPHLRFYAGAPLILDGVAIGALCVIDKVPRPDGLTPDQGKALMALAEQVVSQIRARDRARRWLAEIEAQNALLRVSADHATALIRLGDRLQGLSSQEAVVEAGSAIMAETLGATRAGFGIVDPEREAVVVHPEWRAPGVTSLSGLHQLRHYGSFVDDLKRGELVIIPDVTTDPRTAAKATALSAIGVRVLINVPVLQHDRLVLLGFVHYDWPRALSDHDGTFIRNVADRIQAAILQLRAVEDRRIMNRELGHRLKNTFAMITAIARQTFGGQDREALKSFSSRLVAVGAAYDLLAHERWQATDLASVVGAAIQLAGGEKRMTATGPRVALGADAAMTASMLLHELTTNALKYGALSLPEGQVRIDWNVEGDSVTLTWIETGGPAVVPPTRKGFGSRIVSMGLAGDGESEVDFAPEGLRVRVRARRDKLEP